MVFKNERVLVVEDDPLVGALFEELLPEHDLVPVLVTSTEEALELMTTAQFDLVLADKNLPGRSGIDLLHEVRQLYPDVNVIIMTAYADMQSVLAAINEGAYDYLTKPFDSLEEVIAKVRRALDKRRMTLENRRLIEYLTVANEQIEEMNRELEQKVRERTAQLEEANRKLEALTLTDDVTGLFNQRFLFQRLEEEFLRERRYRDGLAVVMVDLDGFKRVNDEHDHLFGSRVLRRVGGILTSGVRGTDYVVRYGGDEFVVILPHTDLENAALVAERLRHRIQTTDTGDGADEQTAGGPELYPAPFWLTASVGVAALGQCTADSPKSLLRAADKALYAAKRDGRNRVCVVIGDDAIRTLSP